ncbi:hypothetical protein PInf_019797 [Phytophthora infestans]|nr:hypothetical protein PInf_019797 [Phytophthora infestans]
MALRLQVDSDDRLWLLWSSSLRLQPPLAAITSDMQFDQNIRPLDIVSDVKVPMFAFAQGGGGQVSLSSTMSPEMDEEPRPGQTRCASCSQVVALRALLPTTYKAVLAHFQHVIKFLRERVNEANRDAIEWPPNERVVQQAGGVGFGILRYLKTVNSSSDDTNLPSATSGMKAWQGRELLVPPVIRYMHPTLRPEDFARHRQDPIFLHRTVEVCERCCLVYADYATASLEANGLGIRTSASAPALLRPSYVTGNGLPATSPAKKKKRSKKKQERRGRSKDARFVSSREKRAAAEHRGYLVAVLSDAQVQLEHIESLATLIPAPEADPVKYELEKIEKRPKKKGGTDMEKGPSSSHAVVNEEELEREEHGSQNAEQEVHDYGYHDTKGEGERQVLSEENNSVKEQHDQDDKEVTANIDKHHFEDEATVDTPADEQIFHSTEIFEVQENRELDNQELHEEQPDTTDRLQGIEQLEDEETTLEHEQIEAKIQGQELADKGLGQETSLRQN